LSWPKAGIVLLYMHDLAERIARDAALDLCFVSVVSTGGNAEATVTWSDLHSEDCDESEDGSPCDLVAASFSARFDGCAP